MALALGGAGFYVTDWTQDHANFFRSIEITKSMMFVILLMLVAVAAFNIVATLVMIVKEKQTDIAILRTLGAAPRNVLLTFAVQGVLIGLAGTLAGAALGSCSPTTSRRWWRRSSTCSARSSSTRASIT